MFCIKNLKFGRWPLCQGSAADNMTKCDQIISLWAQGAVCFHLRSRDVAGGGLTSVETEYSHFAAPRAIWAVCILPCPGIMLSAETGRDELQLVQVQLPVPMGQDCAPRDVSAAAWQGLEPHRAVWLEKPCKAIESNLSPCTAKATLVPKCHIHKLKKMCRNGSSDVQELGEI